MNNGTTFKSLSSSSSQSTDDSFCDRLSSKSASTNSSTFFQRIIGLSRFTTPYSSQKINSEHSDQQLIFIVHFLDDTQRVVSLDRQCYGSDLINKVFDFSDERSYFGLLIEESSHQWLDPNKTLRKQFQNVVSPIHLDFKVRFYPSDPSSDLKNDFIKYLFVLQIKKSIYTGKLSCSQMTSALLASYLVQGELGDYCANEHRTGYLNDFRFISCENVEFERQVEQFHRQHRGQTAADTERNFLHAASSLEMYGIELHNVSVKLSNSNSELSQSAVDLQLGISAVGISVFHNSTKVNAFLWNRITKISFKRRTFSIQLSRDSSSVEENSIVFTTRNYYYSKYLWKSCVDHHIFFRHSPVVKLRVAENVTQNQFNRMSNRRRIDELSDSNCYVDNMTSTSLLFPPVDLILDEDQNCNTTDNVDQPIRVVQLQPNIDGRYGFNIKVSFQTTHRRRGLAVVSEDGEHRSMVITKVIDRTPASQVSLHEGDILIAVNQIDVQQMTRDEVIDMIRQCRQDFQGKLELWIKPVKIDDCQVKQKHSLNILRDDLQTNRFLEQYNSLSRRYANSTFHVANQRENSALNRYRDVLPYDKTRVILRKDPQTDYINANHIEIPIRSKEIVNRYIATQGPLPTTCSSFWRMIWEQECHIILMLTPLVENNRVKCHQYWPNIFQSINYDCFTIHCRQEREEKDFIYREILLYNDSTDEERCIYQIQNHLWPDQGVPDDCSSFLHSLLEIRNLQKLKPESATLVHCSAGIGRTGVFILIETGLCLIEHNQTVLPLDIVRQMREQRMGMIQTASQYKFACQAILFAYDHGLIAR